MKTEVSTVGIIGGGQLGMFLAQACQKIGLITHIYSDTDDAPAKKYANKIIYGSFNAVSYTHLTLPTICSV